MAVRRRSTSGCCSSSGALDRHRAEDATTRAEGRVDATIPREVIPLFESGALRPVIDSRFALDDIVEAHRSMDANANVGKIVDLTF